MTPKEYLSNFKSLFHCTSHDIALDVIKGSLKPHPITFRRDEVDETKSITCLSIPAFKNKWLNSVQKKFSGKDIAILQIDAKTISNLRFDLDYSSSETHIYIDKLKTRDFIQIVDRSGDFACFDEIPGNSISIIEVVKAA